MKFFEESKSKYDFMQSIDIVCPRCSSKAIILGMNTSKSKVICNNCGYMLEGAIYSLSKYDLWYTTKINGNNLYAYNLEHLDYIRRYIEADLRSNMKTEQGWSNQAVENRLPVYFKKKSNRESVLKSIDQLKSK